MGELGDSRLYTAVTNHTFVLYFMGLYAPKKPARPVPLGSKTLKIKSMEWAKTFRPTFFTSGACEWFQRHGHGLPAYGQA